MLLCKVEHGAPRGALRVKVSFRVWGKLPNRTMIPTLNATANFSDVGGAAVFSILYFERDY